MSDTFHYTGNATLEVLADAKNYNRFLEKNLLDFIRPFTQALDFGAGVGTFAKRLRAAGIKVDCVEPDATTNRQLSNAGFTAFTGLKEAPTGTYDRIYTLNVLEHIEDDAAALSAMHAALRPNGKLFIYVPAFQCLYSSFDAAVGHVRRYHKKELRQRVEAAGFHIDKVCYVDSLGFFAWLLLKNFQRGTTQLNPKAVILFDRLIFPLSRLADLLFQHYFGKNLLLVAKKN